MPVRERRDDLRSLYTPGSRKYWALKRDSARVLYNALKVNADDEGRLEGDIPDVEALVPRARNVGWTPKSIEKDLDEMVEVGLIERYEVSGRTYISVYQFFEKQNWTGVRSEESRLPSPPSKSQSQSQVADSSRTFQAATPPMEKSFTSPKKEESFREADGEVAQHESGLGATEAYRMAKSIFRRYVGKSMGSIGNRAYEWQELINRHGSDVVVAAVEFWSQDIGKRGRDLRWPIAVFLKQAPDWVAEVIASRTATREDGESEEIATMAKAGRPPAVQM